jgi:flagellin
MSVLATNSAANTAVFYLNKNSAAQTSAITMLASGSKITSAASDPSGLAIVTGMNSDSSVLQQAATNLQDGTSVLNTADGAYSNISDILTQMKTLTAQAQSGSSSTTDIGYINTQYQALLGEVDSIASSTNFNGTALISNGSSYSTGGVNFMVGTASTDTINVQLGAADSTTLGIAGTSITAASAGGLMSTLDTAISQISTDRATVGATLQNMTFQGNVINTSLQNLDSAKSSIQDTDIAATESQFSTDQSLTSASVSALMDANQMNQQILKILG